MFADFLFSLNAVLPIFLIIALGYFLRRKAVLSEKTIGEMNNIIFSFALPVMLFRDVYNSDFDGFFDAKMVIWAVVSTILGFVLLWVAAEIFLKKKQAKIGAFVQGSFRGNYAIIGLPLIANILGIQNTGKGVLIVAFVIPIYNVLSVVVLSVKSTRVQQNLFKSTLINILKNPLIIGIVCGLILSGLRIELPGAIHTTINYMGALCTPLALLAVGGTIKISKFIENLTPALVASLVKIVISPLIFIPISIGLLGFRGESLVVLYVMYAAPTAVSSYIMASKMDADAVLASNILILSTILSVFSFTIGIYLLKTFSFI